MAKGTRTYKTRTGKLLTDADIVAMADEAERGYDVEHRKRRDGWDYRRRSCSA